MFSEMNNHLHDVSMCDISYLFQRLRNLLCYEAHLYSDGSDLNIFNGY